MQEGVNFFVTGKAPPEPSPPIVRRAVAPACPHAHLPGKADRMGEHLCAAREHPESAVRRTRIRVVEIDQLFAVQPVMEPMSRPISACAGCTWPGDSRSVRSAAAPHGTVETTISHAPAARIAVSGTNGRCTARRSGGQSRTGIPIREIGANSDRDFTGRSTRARTRAGTLHEGRDSPGCTEPAPAAEPTFSPGVLIAIPIPSSP
jgi:hypothetical protein